MKVKEEGFCYEDDFRLSACVKSIQRWWCRGSLQVIVLAAVPEPLWRLYHHCGRISRSPSRRPLKFPLGWRYRPTRQLWTQREQKAGLTRLSLSVLNIHQRLSYLTLCSPSELSKASPFCEPTLLFSASYLCFVCVAWAWDTHEEQRCIKHC